tara:strand:+ start:7917 stop:8468 length:552 start_codon:yes stop_codon:yes gene_type:complete
MSINRINKFAADVAAKTELQRVELGHIALQDIKTLDSLLKGADKMGDTFTKLYNKYISDEIAAEDASDVYDAEWQKAENQRDAIVALRQTHNKIEEKAEALEEKLETKANKADEKLDKANLKWDKSLADAQNEQKQIGAYVDKFSNAIKSFNTAAKALGVKVDVSKYESARNRLEAKNMKKLT